MPRRRPTRSHIEQAKPEADSKKWGRAIVKMTLPACLHVALTAIVESIVYRAETRPALPRCQLIDFLSGAVFSGASASISFCVFTISTTSEAAVQSPTATGMFHEICNLVTP